MIPPKTFWALTFATNIGWLVGAVPYHFMKDANGTHLIPTLTKGRYIFVRFSFCLNCFYISFITFRVVQKLLSDEEMTLDFLVQKCYLFLSYLMPVVLQVNTLLYYEEIPQYFIQYLAFFKRVKDKYILPGERGPRCIKFFATVLTVGCLVNLQNAIIILKRPYTSHYLTSMLPDPKKGILRFPLLFFQVWIWLSTWAHVWTFVFQLYTYIACMVWTLREMDLKIKDPKTQNRIRDPKIFIRKLRTMHVLHRTWQHCHQSWFMPSHKAVAVFVGTLSSYGVIKLSGPRSMVMGCMAVLSLVYLWTLFRKFGQLYELSEEVLGNWTNSETTTKWMKKFVRSVPIFRIDIGCYYYVKKTTVISVMWTVLNNTITLLFL